MIGSQTVGAACSAPISPPLTHTLTVTPRRLYPAHEPQQQQGQPHCAVHCTVLCRASGFFFSLLFFLLTPNWAPPFGSRLSRAPNLTSRGGRCTGGAGKPHFASGTVFYRTSFVKPPKPRICMQSVSLPFAHASVLSHTTPSPMSFFLHVVVVNAMR